MNIYILRHGEAVDAGEVGGDDEPRYLTDHGRKRSRAAACGMSWLGLAPDLILTSPFPRALQTAEITAEVLDCEKAIKQEKSLRPGAEAEALIRLLDSQKARKDIMVVGHNPDLEDLAARLIASAGTVNFQLKKGGLVMLAANRPLRPGAAILTGFWTAKQLGRLAGPED